MPESILPAAARVLPPAGQALWIKAFKEAKLKGLPEDEASAFAWAAVKRAGYSKQANGKWGKFMDAQLMIENDTINIGVPFVKINAQKRTVAGFATLDNVDKAGDLLDAEASKEAFKKWAGNIREMHEKKAVGRAIDIVEKTYTDKDGNTYNGIWVEARVSKGAEDTWQKVLDGTLNGFSVGGAVQEKERAIAKLGDQEVEVWRVTKYSLNEVSLVDNPCNGLALVTLVKSVDGALEYADELDEATDELFEKAHQSGGNDCCEAEIEAVITALNSWRQREIDKGRDGEVANISYMMQNVRSYAKMESYEHEDHERMVAAVSKLDESEGDNMEKIADNLQDKENSDISLTNDELTDEHKGVLRKLAELVLGIKPATDEVTQEETDKEELAKEGDTSDMKEEEIKALVDGASDELAKSVDGKFGEIGESLSKISELLESVAKTDALDELKKELDEKVAEIANRVEALETSGAVKKSGDKDSSEELEKSDKGLWADSIVPEFLRKQVG